MKYSVLSCIKSGGEYYNPGDSIVDPVGAEDMVKAGLIVDYDPELKDEVDAAEAAKPAPPKDPDNLQEIKGLGPDIEATMKRTGIDSFATLSNTPVEQLAEMPGVSKSKAKAFVKAAKKLAG